MKASRFLAFLSAFRGRRMKRNSLSRRRRVRQTPPAALILLEDRLLLSSLYYAAPSPDFTFTGRDMDAGAGLLRLSPVLDDNGDPTVDENGDVWWFPEYPYTLPGSDVGHHAAFEAGGYQQYPYPNPTFPPDPPPVFPPVSPGSYKVSGPLTLDIVPTTPEENGQEVVMRFKSQEFGPKGAISGSVAATAAAIEVHRVNASGSHIVSSRTIAFTNAKIANQINARVGDTIVINITFAASDIVSPLNSPFKHSMNLEFELIDGDIKVTSAELQDANKVKFEYETMGNPGKFDVGLYRSVDGKTYSPSDLVVGSLKSVTPRSANPQSLEYLPLPEGFHTDITKPYLLVVADPNRKITELREDNNIQNVIDLHISYLGTTTFIATDNITLKASIGVPLAGAQVLWTVQGQGAAAGIAGFPTAVASTTDDTGTATFTFKPSDNPALVTDRHTNWTKGRKTENPAISFKVAAKYVASGVEHSTNLAADALGPLQQDKIDTLRQEYYDYQIPVPTRSEVVPSLGQGFNQSPYGFQLDDHLVEKYNAILAGYRGSQVTVTIGGVKYLSVIPMTADLTISNGYRNPQYNKAIGSRFQDSKHTRGRALDLVVPSALQSFVIVNGQRTRITLALHGTLYPALQAAAATQGTAIAERGSARVPVGDSREDHIHVQW